MLEVYKDKQPLFYDEVKNSITNNKISHAYMLETNNYILKDDLILSFIKTLFCQNHNLEQSNCLDCNICHLIDNNSLSDFKIIEPDGAWIKKDQILGIKEAFKTTSFENRPRIYWIKGADKLNKQAANSLLKFLEEPEGNIIAILEVDNRYKVLETIRSRCQIYSFVNHEKSKEIENIELLTEIIKTLENKKEKAIAYLPITLDNNYYNKDFWKSLFLDMINIYESAIRKQNNLNFSNYGDILELIISKNSISGLINKVSVLFEMVNNLNYNLNMTMMIDQFVIKFNGGE